MKNKHKKKKKRKFQHSKSSKTIEGNIILTARGIGFLKDPSLSEDIKIDQEHLNTALHNDLVKVATHKSKRSNRTKGQVTEILERAQTEFVGTVNQFEGAFFFTPDNKKIYLDISLIQNRKLERAKPNDKVIVKIEEWTNPNKNPKGEIVKILGQKGVHNVEMESIVYEKGFPPTFPKNIEKEAEKIKARAPQDLETEIQRRKSQPNPPPSGWDFRNTTTFTIDPFDAKDFDDALSFKDLGNNTYEIGIHIADVTHYVKEDSEIEKEAQKRATSVYLVDRTIPMLPEVLSNDLCSLNPNEDKLAFSAIFIVNDKCEVQERWFGETIINSDKRFTYKEAQRNINRHEGDFWKELVLLNEMALLKRNRRTKNGAITFGGLEVQFELDKEGFPIAVHEKEMFETNELIEDYMLLANREVSEYIDRLNKKTGATNPFVYRVHDTPKNDAIIELKAFLQTIGFDLKADEFGNIEAKDLNHLLDFIQGLDEEDLIEKAILKSMSKAVYSTNNIGHFGLAFKHYTHFTSPIRRYPDMMVHRLMKRYLQGEEISNEEIGKYNRLSTISTDQEIAAVDAERNSEKYKYVQYMSERIGKEFDGVISGIVDWGVYVQEIETKAEGLVRVSTLKGDFFNVDTKNYRLVGEKTGQKYTLGDRVKIKVTATDLDKRTIDFEIVT